MVLSTVFRFDGTFRSLCDSADVEDGFDGMFIVIDQGIRFREDLLFHRIVCNRCILISDVEGSDREKETTFEDLRDHTLNGFWPWDRNSLQSVLMDVDCVNRIEEMFKTGRCGSAVCERMN